MLHYKGTGQNKYTKKLIFCNKVAKLADPILVFDSIDQSLGFQVYSPLHLKRIFNKY